MKKHNHRIQAIICEIDEVLSQPSTITSHKIIEETLRKSQQVLQETLGCLTQDLDKSSHLQLLSIDSCSASEETLQSKHYILEEFFAPINQYLQEDLTILKKQRQALQEEIRKLEKEKQENYSLAQQHAKQEQIIFEFSQILLGQVQEILVEHLSYLANQYLSAVQSGLSSNQNISPQTIKDIETSKMIEILEDKLEGFSKYNKSFIYDSNNDNSNEIKPIQEKYIESNISSENVQIRKQSPETNELNKSQGQSVFPYPGYEFFGTVDMEPKTTEIDPKKLQPEGLNNQEYSFEYQSSTHKKQDLEMLKSSQQENEAPPQLEPPSFEENYAESQNYQNRFLKIEDEAPITLELKLETSEKRENLNNVEVWEDLINLFGNPDIDKGPTKQSITTTKNQQNMTNSIDELEEDIYIQASVTQSLLPVEEPQKKPKELLLDSQTLECLRYDLESLEEIDGDELIDDQDQTQLQLGEYQHRDLTENTPEFSEKNLVMPSEAELTNLEDLFMNLDDVSDKSVSSDQEKISSSLENTEHEISIEDVLDNLTPETDEEIIEADGHDFLSLKTLFED